MKNPLNFIHSLTKAAQPTIKSYGQTTSGVPPHEIQSIMEWLMSSLLNAGYFGRSHLIWDDGDQDWRQVILTGMLKNEPVFLSRCGERPSPPPDNCYWRLMPEHPSLKIYQLEVREDE